METAFQADAFQNDAFQIASLVFVVDGRSDDEEVMELLLMMDA